jgi:hypothetical protein
MKPLPSFGHYGTTRRRTGNAPYLNCIDPAQREQRIFYYQSRNHAFVGSALARDPSSVSSAIASATAERPAEEDGREKIARKRASYTFTEGFPFLGGRPRFNCMRQAKPPAVAEVMGLQAR